MRHLKAGRKLGRNASHRKALMRNLAVELFRHERIITTLEKAKEARPFVERLITLAKKGSLHARRLVIARLGPPAKAEVAPEDDENTEIILNKLFNEIGPRFADRPGGYTRVVKRHERRLGDGGRTAYLELLQPGETKVRKRAPAPAPRVTIVPPAPAPTPTPAPPPEAPPPAPPAPEATTAAEQPNPPAPPAAETPPSTPPTPPPA